MIKAPYPWQQAQWQQLQQRHQQQRLPHALLLEGPAGMGKLHFAEALAQSLLCEQPQNHGEACGGCRSCRLFVAGSHPDYRPVQPEEEGKAITVDAIRKIAHYQAQKAQYGRYQVVMIEPAEQMNLNAANALLKTLEEPTAQTLLILVSAASSRLLPTIRSRCQSLLFRTDSARAPGLDWLRAQNTEIDAEHLLAMAGGAPLAALELSESDLLAQRTEVFEAFEGLTLGRLDPVATAQDWQSYDLQWLLNLLYGWIADLIRLKSVQGGTDLSLDNPDLQQRLQPLVEQVDLAKLYKRLDKLQSVKGLSHKQLNKQLMLEDLLLIMAH